MSRSSLLSSSEALSFPRVSGDEPRPEMSDQVSAVFSPRERG